MSVFIAAMGAISGAGTGVHMAWDAMRSGKSLAERVEAPVRVGSRIVSTAVRAPEDAIALSARERRRLPRAAQLALVAVDDMMGTSVPMTTGSAMILVGTTFRASAEYADHPPGRLPLLAEAYAVPNAIASLVAERVGSSGPSMVVTTACASGIEVLNVAAWAVNSGQVDTVICVAVDVLFATAVVTGFAQIGAIATSESDSPNPLEVCRPFDRHRDGFVLGEAAAPPSSLESRHLVRLNSSHPARGPIGPIP